MITLYTSVTTVIFIIIALSLIKIIPPRDHILFPFTLKSLTFFVLLSVTGLYCLLTGL